VKNVGIIEQVFVVLSLMREFKKIEGRTRLQKLVFLLDNKNTFGFDFMKSNYGPFSGRLSDLLDNMKRDGWIKEEATFENEKKKYIYEITDAGIKEFVNLDKIIKDSDVKEKITQWTSNIKNKGFVDMALVDFLKFIYESYPDFAGEYFH
jgi:uncharacterized protein YwgA